MHRPTRVIGHLVILPQCVLCLPDEHHLLADHVNRQLFPPHHWVLPHIW